MFETFHRFAEAHRDKMALALTVEDARRIAESGRMPLKRSRQRPRRMRPAVVDPRSRPAQCRPSPITS
jgi:hypothetical protein